jgi:hypothetical protein
MASHTTTDESQSPPETPEASDSYRAKLGRGASVIKIAFLECVATLCLGPVIVGLIAWPGLLGVHQENPHQPGYFLFAAGLGLTIATWSVRGMVRPRVIGDSWQPMLKLGSWMVPNPFLRQIVYKYPSTRPYYALLELFFALCWSLLVVPYHNANGSLNADGSYDAQAFLGYAFAGVAVFFPAMRLFCWYVLRLRLPPQQPPS